MPARRPKLSFDRRWCIEFSTDLQDVFMQFFSLTMPVPFVDSLDKEESLKGFGF